MRFSFCQTVAIDALQAFGTETGRELNPMRFFGTADPSSLSLELRRWS